MRAALMLAEMGFKIINLRGGTSRLEITQWALRLCALADIFKQVFSKFDKDEVYYRNFAPSYIELVNAVEHRKTDAEKMSINISDLNTYKSRFEDWFGSDIEDAIFEEIK